MPFRAEGSTRRYIGLSGEPKPAIGAEYHKEDGSTGIIRAANLTPGSTFKEADTGRIYYFDGERWYYAFGGDELTLNKSVADLVSAVALLTAEVAALRWGMIEAGTAKAVSAESLLNL